MGLPAKQRTRRSRDERRSHHALKAKTSRNCEKCGEPVLPHRACTNCGTYRGKQAIDVAKRVARKQRNKKAVN